VKRFVTWADINYIHEPGSYNFQDGILDIEQTHLDPWERDLEGVWEVARHLVKAGTWVPVIFHPSESGLYEDRPGAS
jgi:hypothetical protein